jgi:tryptophan synthase alpha chain
VSPVEAAPAPCGVEVEPTLRALVERGRKLLVTYVTGGLRDDWVEVLQAMVAAGADVVEIGLPFSDPVMDGPTIQEASAAALARGATPPSILAGVRDADIPVPLVAMTYANLVVRAGHRRFAAELATAGIRGAILPDIPLEELDDWARAAQWAGVATVLLAAPVTPDDRLAELCRRSQGFVYGVNLMGVTGERTSVASSAGILARRLKAVTDLPVVMGFGVSSPSQAAAIAEVADGVVVASALMRAMLSGESPDEIGSRVGSLRAALDAG